MHRRLSKSVEKNHMARLYPEFDPEKTSLKKERDVARALVRDLPDECLIY